HLPVFLGRFPREASDRQLAAFYGSLLQALSDPTFRHGRWQLCEANDWPGDDRAGSLVAWCLTGETKWLVVVNLSDATAAGMVTTPFTDVRGRSFQLHDPTTGATYDRDGSTLLDGLFVQLDAWSWHLFRIDALENGTHDS